MGIKRKVSRTRITGRTIAERDRLNAQVEHMAECLAVAVRQNKEAVLLVDGEEVSRVERLHSGSGDSS